MTTLLEDLRVIRRQFVRDDYVSRVKARVHEHVSNLEPGAAIEDTLYFNHSAIPDFVLTWPSGAKRNYYLRSSYASIVAAEDTERIATGDPVFLALDNRQAIEEPGFTMTPEDVSRAANVGAHTLVTDVGASGAIATTARGEDGNPLTEVVRSNFLKGARGLVDEDTAALLIDADRPLESALIREKFFEDALYRMERTSAIVALAQDTAGAEDADALIELLEGRLTAEEVSRLLPWVLRNARSENETFWRTLGSMIDLCALEAIANEIDEVNISALVRANLDEWEAKRAYVGLNIDQVENAQRVEQWVMSRGLLELRLQDTALRLSTSGNKLQRRPGGRSVRWSDLADRLSAYSIDSVRLSGRLRTFSIHARDAAAINRDIDAATQSMEDDYFADEVTLVVERGTRPALLALDVPGGLISSSAPLSLGFLTGVAVDAMFPSPK